MMVKGDITMNESVQSYLMCDQYLNRLGVDEATRHWIMSEVMEDNSVPPMAKLQSCLDSLSGDEMQTRLSIVFPELVEHQSIDKYLKHLSPAIHRSSMSSTFRTRSIPAFIADNVMKALGSVENGLRGTRKVLESAI